MQFFLWQALHFLAEALFANFHIFGSCYREYSFISENWPSLLQKRNYAASWYHFLRQALHYFADAFFANFHNLRFLLSPITIHIRILAKLFALWSPLLHRLPTRRHPWAMIWSQLVSVDLRGHSFVKSRNHFLQHTKGTFVNFSEHPSDRRKNCLITRRESVLLQSNPAVVVYQTCNSVAKKAEQPHPY